MKHKIIIEVKDGMVEAVYSTDSDDEIIINDMDIMSPSDCVPIPKSIERIY